MSDHKIGDLFVELAIRTGALDKDAKGAQAIMRSIGDEAAAVALGMIGANGISAAFDTVRGALVDAVKDFAAMEAAMLRVSTIVDTSKVNIGALCEEVERLAVAYGMDGAGLAGALEKVIRGGVDASKSIEVLNTAIKLGMATGTDTSASVDALTNSMRAFGIDADKAGDTADSLFVAMKYGNTTLDEYSQTMAHVGPLANQLGISFDEVNAAMIAMRQSGVSMGEAGTTLRAMFMGLLKAQGDAKALSEKLGLQFDIDAVKTKGLAGFLNDLAEKTGGSTEALEMLFPAAKGLQGVAVLTGEGLQKMNDRLVDFKDKAGTAGEAADKIKTGLAFEWKSLTEDVGQAGESFAGILAPGIDKAIAAARNFVDTLAGIYHHAKEQMAWSEEQAAAMREQAKSTDELTYAQEQMTSAFGELPGFDDKAMFAMDAHVKAYQAYLETEKKANEEKKKSAAADAKAAADAIANKEALKKAAEAEKKDDADLLENKMAYWHKLAENRKKSSDEEKALRAKTAEAMFNYDKQEYSQKTGTLLAILNDEKRSDSERIAAHDQLSVIIMGFAEKEMNYELMVAETTYLEHKKAIENLGGDNRVALEALRANYDQTIKNIKQKAKINIETEMSAVVNVEIDKSKIKDISTGVLDVGDSLLNIAQDFADGVEKDLGKAVVDIVGEVGKASQTIVGSLSDNYGGLIGTFTSGFKAGYNIVSAILRTADNTEEKARLADQYTNSMYKNIQGSLDAIAQSQGIYETAGKSKTELRGMATNMLASLTSNVNDSLGTSYDADTVRKLLTVPRDEIRQILATNLYESGAMDAFSASARDLGPAFWIDMQEKFGIKYDHKWVNGKRGYDMVNPHAVDQNLFDQKFGNLNSVITSPVANQYQTVHNMAANAGMPSQLPIVQQATSYSEAKTIADYYHDTVGKDDLWYYTQLRDAAYRWYDQIDAFEWDRVMRGYDAARNPAPTAAVTTDTTTTQGGVPEFGFGGLATSPGIVSENSQPELVLPLNSPDRVYQLMGQYGLLNGGGNTTVSLNVTVDPMVGLDPYAARLMGEGIGERVVATLKSRGINYNG